VPVLWNICSNRNRRLLHVSRIIHYHTIIKNMVITQ